MGWSRGESIERGGSVDGDKRARAYASFSNIKSYVNNFNVCKEKILF